MKKSASVILNNSTTPTPNKSNFSCFFVWLVISYPPLLNNSSHAYHWSTLYHNNGRRCRVSNANTSRLKTFQSRWDEMCTKLDDAVVLTGITPSSSIETCMGLNHPLRGVGLSMTFSSCISKALKSNYDFAFFYEDDATLFDEKFCSKDYQQVSERTETNSPKTKLIIILAETYKLLSIRRSSYAAGRTPFQGEKRGPLRPFYSQCFRPIEGFSRQVSERSERALMKTKILSLDESTPAK